MKTLKQITEEELKKFEEKFSCVWSHDGNIPVKNTYYFEEDIKSLFTASLFRVALAMKEAIMMVEDKDIMTKGKHFCSCYFTPNNSFCKYAQGFNDYRAKSKSQAKKFIKTNN